MNLFFLGGGDFAGILSGALSSFHSIIPNAFNIHKRKSLPQYWLGTFGFFPPDNTPLMSSEVPGTTEGDTER